MLGRLLDTVIVALILLPVAGAAPGVDAGSPLTVTKSEDTNDGTCDADCSLREAIVAANAAPATDAINVGAGTYTLTLAGGSEDLAATGDLDILADVAIAGAGDRETTIDAAGLDRVFHIVSGAEVTMTGLTITGGQEDAAFGGGGILNFGGLTLRASRVTGNSAIVGGGIINYGTLAVRASTIDNNVSGLDGGGIWLATGAIGEIESSTINGNRAGPSQIGGGVSNMGALNIVNSTISGNIAAYGGAIITIGDVGQATISSSTIAFNEGLEAVRTANSATTTLENTIVAENSGDQCFTASDSASLTSNGHNLASDDTCNLTADGDLANGDARLSPLADNGGPTFTHALRPGSDAINAGDPGVCPNEDQRGQLRNDVCDIGSFEYIAVPTWGDLDCDGEISTRDNQALLRKVLAQAPLSQTEPCPDIGDILGVAVPASAEQLTWGNLDCDQDGITTRDNQALLRNVLTQAALSQTEPCPDIGATVNIID